MKKIIVSMIVIISGCAMSPDAVRSYQEKENFEGQKFETVAKERKSVRDLREEYKKNTGLSLPQQNTFSCRKDASCYYGKYASEFDSLMNDFRREERAKDEQEERAKCDANKQCRDKEMIDKYRRSLRDSYYFALGSHPYQQADYDMVMRTMCEKAAGAHKNGMSLQTLVTNLLDIPGISPMDREQVVSVAKACWNLSRLNSDWKEALRQPY